MMDILYVCMTVFLLLMVCSQDVLTEVIVTPSFSKEDNTATIECRYSNTNADLNVLSWYRSDETGSQNGDPLVSSDTTLQNGRYSLNTTTGSSSWNLYISGVTKSDKGNYACNAVFIGGFIENGFAYLTVQYLDTPIVTGPSTPVLADSTTTLFCSMPDGVPTQINFSWMRNDVLLNIGGRLRGSLNKQNLTIDQVNSNDTGDYRCRAENSEFSGSNGKTSSNVANLEVNYITITTMRWVGGTVTCGAEGNPPPTVTIEVGQSDVSSGTSSVSADIACDTSLTVSCVSDNGGVNPEVSEKFEACDDACRSGPCLNAGVCTSSSSNDDGFSCNCASGFKGVTCQNESGSSAGLIVGVVIAVIAIIVIVVLVFLYCRRRKEKEPESSIGYSARPADVEMSNEAASRQPLKTGDEPKRGLGVNKELQKSNDMLYDAREDAKMDGGKAVGVMI